MTGLFRYVPLIDRKSVYAVIVRGREVRVGEVYKRRSTKVIHRDGKTLTWWQARNGTSSIKDGGGQMPAQFTTRTQAAQALLRKHEGDL